MTPPLVVDVDGTLGRPDLSIDGRALDVLRGWDAPVVVATGKALPYPIALCQFAGVPPVVIAENGGVAATPDRLVVHGDREAADAVAREYEAEGYDLGWRGVDFANRWRETEVAVARESPVEPLRDIAASHGLEVVDTGFAYHVKSPDVSKGKALREVADGLGVDPAAFLAVGDSANDVSTFEVAGQSYAVANADDAAREAADAVTEASYADGFLEAVAAAGYPDG